jgi:hypothetical protein
MISMGPQGTLSTDAPWLNLESLAQVELASEDPAHPAESALIPGGSGWRAAEPGKQFIRLLFDQPQKITRISLVFEEYERERTQEFVLLWSSDGGQSYQEVVRQQYHFSPPGTVREIENYIVALDGLTTLELSILPDISGGAACASIAQLQLR